MRSDEENNRVWKNFWWTLNRPAQSTGNTSSLRHRRGNSLINHNLDFKQKKLHFYEETTPQNNENVLKFNHS